MTNEDRYARALVDPADVFATPDEVLTDAALSEAQKIEILRRWEYDASETSVAEEEGMPDRGGVELGHVLQALHQLVPDIDTERSPPTKQGGIDRAALKPKPPKG